MNTTDIEQEFLKDRINLRQILSLKNNSTEYTIEDLYYSNYEKWVIKNCSEFKAYSREGKKPNNMFVDGENIPNVVQRLLIVEYDMAEYQYNYFIEEGIELTEEWFIYIQLNLYEKIFPTVNDVKVLASKKKWIECLKKRQAELSKPQQVINSIKMDPTLANQLFEKLKKAALIPDNTAQSHFSYWVGASNDKPVDLKPLGWIRSRSLLAYFIQKSFCIKESDKFPDKAACEMFGVKGLRQSQYQYTGNKKTYGKPIGFEIIDQLFID